MRISSLSISNYRQLRDFNISFDKKSENDLHIFIGSNGAGKSNILNAINWCLYYEEPHLHNESKALPLVNLQVIREADEGEIRNVKVEIKTSTDDGVEITYTRENWYRILKQGKVPFLMEDKFEVSVTGNDGNTKFITGEEANDYVKRFVPNGIREYFFFDGERLDKYFVSTTGPKIRKSIFEISQVELLQTIEDRLNTTCTEFRREATKNSPDLNKLNNEYEVLKKQYKNILEDIVECDNQISISKNIIEECEEYLRGLPDVEKLEKRREELNNKSKSKKDLLNDKQAMQQKILREYTTIIYLYPHIKKSIEIIEYKKSSNQLPPNFSKDLLKSIVGDKHCIICDRDLDDKGIEYINKLLSKINLSSTTSNILLQMEPNLKVYVDKIKNYKTAMSNIRKDIKGYEQDLEEIQNEINLIDNELRGYKDKDKIKDKHMQRKTHETLLEDNKHKQWNLQDRKEKIVKSQEEKKSQLDVAMAKNSKKAQIKRECSFCEKAIDNIINVKNKIMEDNRVKIQNETENYFMSFVWKKETFKNVSINDNYDLSLIHKDSYECLGSCSAAEKALLALSFTLSLHKVSGFLSPLVIDTPISRVSDTNRENFARVLARVSKNKQIILLFTPSEYSNEINEQFDSIYSTKNMLVSTTENQTINKEV